MSHLNDFKTWWAHAFAVDDPAQEWSAQERELVERLARFVVRRRMTTPALMALETGRPLNFIGSQFLVFLSPFLKFIFSPAECDLFAEILQKRHSIDFIIDTIVERENHE
jgi:hypothetical protein